MNPTATTGRSLVQGRALSRILRVDAGASLLSGLAMLALSGPAAGWVGLPRALLLVGGVVLLGWTAALSVAASGPVPRAAILAVIECNVLWAVASVGLVVLGWASLTGLGVAVVLAQASAVCVAAYVEAVALRQAAAA